MVKSSVSPFILLGSDTFNCAELEVLYPIIGILFIVSTIHSILNTDIRPILIQRHRPNRKRVDIVCFKAKPRGSRNLQVCFINRLDPNFIDRTNIFYINYENNSGIVDIDGIPYTAQVYSTRNRSIRRDYRYANPYTYDIDRGLYVKYKILAHVYYDIRSNSLPIFQHQLVHDATGQTEIYGFFYHKNRYIF